MRARNGSLLVALAVAVGLGFPAAATAFSSLNSVLATTSPQVTQIGIVNGAGVTYSDPGFSPDPVTVVIGVNNTVTWTDNDYVSDPHGVLSDHTVTASDNSFTSPLLNPGDTFTYTFTTGGTFAYHCNVHPWMQGLVVVKGTATPVPEFPLSYVVLLVALGACAVVYRLAKDGSRELLRARVP